MHFYVSPQPSHIRFSHGVIEGCGSRECLVGIEALGQAFPQLLGAMVKQSLFNLNLKAPLYWVVDGLDEADDSDAFVKLLSELSQTISSIRVIIFSRPTHPISSSFQRLQSEGLLHVDTLHAEGNQRDFRRYIEQELDIAAEESYKEHIVSDILSRSRGNFLWVHLAIQKINKCYTKLDVETALEDLPPGMENLYDRMATSIQTNKPFDIDA